MARMLRHTLYVGLNDKDTKKQVCNRNTAKKVVMGIVGDCTISDAIGHYTHEDGTDTKEKSIKVELLFKADNEVLCYARQIKKALNQESIALVKDYIDSELI